MACKLAKLGLATLLLSSYVLAEESPAALEARAAIPNGWTYRGCWVDDPYNRIMTYRAPDNNAMTIESCTTLCSGMGYSMAGVEWGIQCFCSKGLVGAPAPAVENTCNVACGGNGNELCGGGPRIGIWSPNAVTVGSIPAGWTYRGCWTDDPYNRVMTYRAPDNNAMTIDSCTTLCKGLGYSQAGVEWGIQCFCSNGLVGAAAAAAENTCNVACSGNGNEICGGGARVGVWSPNAVTAPGAGGTIPAGWTYRGCWVDDPNNRIMTFRAPDNAAMTIESCTTLCKGAGYSMAGVEWGVQCFCSNSLVNAAAPAVENTCNVKCGGNGNEVCGGGPRVGVWSPNAVTVGSIPNGWTYRGCWVDDPYNRIMTYRAPDNAAMTLESCTTLCKGMGYTIAGAEWGVQCFCSNSLVGAAAPAVENTCNVACGGNANEICGGGPRLSVYSPNAIATVGNGLVRTYGNWQYQGCIVSGAVPAAFIMGPSWRTATNTVNSCLDSCAKFGYMAGALLAQVQCWCGDVADVAASNSQGAADGDCNAACPGNNAQFCGANNRFAWYKWTGAALYNWAQPTGNGLGIWEAYATLPIVPLIATLGLNNKVVFMEKTASSETQGSTGTYELDLGTHQVRTLHVQTDVFCSAGITLPDKAGRQLVIGGWSDEATYGVRLLTPDGVSDWQENNAEIHLAAGRWYPSAMIMANGSILVIGGENGANGTPTPSLELLPSGNGVVYFQWLQASDPWNLYPFLFVLPGGGILVCYYQTCRILEEVDFNTVSILPTIPGSMMGDFPGATEGVIGGRSYPLEGTGVIFPQHAPYTDPVTIMMCGGSTPYGATGMALDNCVSIQPEVPGAQWTIERMPTRRVLSCMVALPDGTFIITCGAFIGTAGFGTQSNPNRQTLLYDPTKPAGSRMSILGSDPLDRLYHSEAILLPDGAVMVSGSDPEAAPYIQEYRVERLIPPYLMGNPAKPEFQLVQPQNNYAYGATITLTFTGDVGKFSLMGAVSSTHGNSMGQRVLFPSFNCNGNTCYVQAPPGAHVCPPGWYMLFLLNGAGVPGTSSWVRIGGDPANLGAWPAGLADFTPPGSG